MSRRLSIEETHKKLTTAEETVRRNQEAKTFALGWPAAPEYLWNDRPLWAVWKKLGAGLLDRRLLSYSDGDALFALATAYKNGQTELSQKLYDETWGNREPFPDPKPPAEHTLADFLTAVRRERESFAARMVPSETICRAVAGEPYEWTAGKPAAIAREYALEVVAGKIVAGELLRRAADRFLKDLEQGHTRGIFFDPVAALHVCQFAEIFCALKLLPWQVFVLANVFGWKKPSGARRFTEAWVSCSKKNGKTRLASTVALWGLICDCEQYPDIFSAATKKDQSRLVWRDAKRAVQDNPELRAYVKRWSGALTVAETDGTFTPLSADEKSMDGLRPHVIIADEVAFWGDREQWDKLVKGTVSRVSPLTFAVTTAGSLKFCFAFGKFDLGEKILRGIYADDSTFVVIFSIDKDDDPLNQDCWPKSNPSLGVTIRVEHLQKTRDEILQDASGLNSWLQYHCNTWPDVTLTRVGSIPAPKWDKCAGLDLIGDPAPWAATIKFLELNYETPCMGGLDVGLSSDMSCYVQLWPRARFAAGGDLVDKKVLVAQFFMPELGLLEKERAWNVPLSAWARTGWIQLLPGDMTDPREIRKFILQMASRFVIREIGFDSWNAQVLCAEVNESGAAQCVAVPQTAKELTAPARELLTAVNNGDLVHLGNPVLAWHAGNVILKEDERHGGTKPEKLSYNEKIDGISATLNAWHRLLASPMIESVYNKRGLILL